MAVSGCHDLEVAVLKTLAGVGAIVVIAMSTLAACGNLSGENGGNGGGLLGSIGEGESEGGGGVADNTCTSGKRWSGGNEGSGDMRPGTDCNACHRDRGEGPIFGAAGTVYPSAGLNDKTDCFGAGGVTVEITDANGTVHTATTRSSGNFYLRDKIATPFNAKLIKQDGTEVAMITAQTVTDCNSCHTERGANLALGRIVTP